MLATLVALALASVSCSKEYAKNIEGNYEGTFVKTVSGITMGSYSATVAIEATSDDEVTLSIPAMGEGISALPKMLISKVSVDRDGNVYSLKRDQFSFSSDGISYTVSLDGKQEDGKLNLACDVTSGNMSTPIHLSFSNK